MLLFDGRSAGESLKESLVCRLPSVYAVAEYLGGTSLRKDMSVLMNWLYFWSHGTSSPTRDKDLLFNFRK